MKALISIAVALFVLGFAQGARAGQVVYTYNFASTSESWTGNGGLDTTDTYQSGVGNPAGSLESSVAGRNKKNAVAGWLISGITWEDLGVPAGATVTSVDGKFDWQCSEYTVGDPLSESGSLTITDSLDVAVTAANLETGVTFSSTTSWATLNSSGAQTVTSSNASSSSIKIKMLGHLECANNPSAVVTRQMDTVVLTINYTEGRTRRIIIVD